MLDVTEKNKLHAQIQNKVRGICGPRNLLF